MTQSQHSQSQQSRSQRSGSDESHSGPIEDSLAGLFDIGRHWAAHGLSIGKSALQTSAQTLQITADVLGRLGEQFAVDPEPAEPEPEPESDEPSA
ncbi:MAG: hypothetical protein OEY14_18675 [Myxococcales bacterium]|nr:hypothetical protein [Myxococcales bacterium]